MKDGRTVVVLGPGAVGLAALMAARVVDADPIIAVDITDERLERARELGASHVINGKREDTKARILDITRRDADYTSISPVTRRCSRWRSRRWRQPAA